MKKPFPWLTLGFLIVSNWVSLCFLSPYLRGVSFTGSLIGGLGISACVVLLLLFGLGVLGILHIRALRSYLIRHYRRTGSMKSLSSIAEVYINFGFWKWSVLIWSVCVLLNTAAWKLVAAVFACLQIAGFEPAVITSALWLLLVTSSYVAVHPDRIGNKFFRESLLASVAEKKKEADLFDNISDYL